MLKFIVPFIEIYNVIKTTNCFRSPRVFRSEWRNKKTACSTNSTYIDEFILFIQKDTLKRYGKYAMLPFALRLK